MKKIKYEGRDLEAMDFAQKYHTWILNYFRPYLGDKVMEVGAGSGSFSALLADLKPKALIAVEPSDEMFPLLENALKQKKGVKVSTYKNFFADVKSKIKKDKVSSAVYINVFEHIENDREELKNLYETLPNGAHVCIFVPANPSLMSKFDKSIGHYRRYTKKELAEKVQEAGFDIKICRRFDIAGVLPWYVKFTLGGSTTMQPGLTKIYDKVVVPIVKTVEKLVEPPMGKNVILVAEKRD